MKPSYSAWIATGKQERTAVQEKEGQEAIYWLCCTNWSGQFERRPPVGEAAGGLFPWASTVLPGVTGNTVVVASSPTRKGSPGRTGVPANVQPGEPAA
eukprot:2004525-Amphidinium_carterae.2